MSQTMINLNDDPGLDAKHKEVLARIRKTYGNTTQILVSNEEMCELAAVCAKFPRFSDPDEARKELHDKAVDEVADALIVLDHVINIFGLTDGEIRARITGKVNRIERWLSASDSQEQTLKDRIVNDQPNETPVEEPPCNKVVPCRGCKHVGQFQNLKPGGRCNQCSQNGWRLFESSQGGYRVNHQTDRVSGSKVAWPDFAVLQLRAQKQGKVFPEEVILIIKNPSKLTRLEEDTYGVYWEARWA